MPDGTLESDILIVGAGPVGLFGAYYAGFRGLSVAVMDSLPEPGGQISAMYPEKQIFDIAGFPAVKGRDLVSGLLAQASRFDPRYLLGHRADTLERTADGFVVTAHTGVSVACRAVVVTGGIGTFTPRRLPAGSEYEGRGLVYFVPDPAEHAGKDVVIVGGGDSAFDWALALEPIARSVTLVHRRAAFRAHAETVRLVRESRVEIITGAQITRVFDDSRILGSRRGPQDDMDGSGGTGGGSGGVVQAVELNGGERVLRAQTVVAALGFTANLGPLNSWGVDIVDRRHISVDTTMSTSVPGVFAAGDITDYPGKVRLIAVGFGEVATAVNNAAVLIDPDAALFPGHSTDAAVTRAASTKVAHPIPV